MTRVKICGIRTLRDALIATESGADFIGLVFVPNRRRRVEAHTAEAIVEGVRKSGGTAPKMVGLFADQPQADVNRTIKACGLDLAQLCGSESLDYCNRVQAQVIKVLHVSAGPDRPAGDEPLDGPAEIPGGSTSGPNKNHAGEQIITGLSDQIQRYRDAGHMVTLDSAVEGLQGGTGRRFDWQIAARLATDGHAFLLAGGLTPADVARAVAEVQPWGVDVSSGVETDGVKDAQKIRAFIRNAHGKPA